MGPDTLLNLCCRSVAIQLGFDSHSIDVTDIPEPEIALRVWRAYEGLHYWRCQTLQCWDRQVLSKFSYFWSIRVLRLNHHVKHAYLESLQLLRGTLEHLEVSTCASDLHWCIGFNKLKCLSLYGENLHPLALHAMAGLPSLHSLDLHGMQQLTDSIHVGPVLASLPSLQHLDLGNTSIGDSTIESLTYTRHLASWESQKGKGALSGSQSDWPQLKLKTLVLQGTKVTPACLEHLHVLSELEYLDMRKTAVKRQDLIGLEKHLRLHAQHGGAVLSVSATLAVVLQQTRPKVCACDYNVGSAPLERWQQESIRQLIYSC
ncbi:hypothetical protein WJX75_004741 [Coccomyxa subellipsoidea]|uniref:RNI-like protein n=1 Tax=Coccomyxa subellipsoidea TaxID=248742 RepID=A0ABR2YDV0_9CHLO